MFRTIHEIVRCVCSILYFTPIIFHLVYKKYKFTQNTIYCYNSHSLSAVLYAAPSFSSVPLSVTELITKVRGE